MSSTLHSLEGDAERIAAADARIRSHVRWTPLERSASLSMSLGTDVFLKLECWQPTRSFKVRGAFNAVAALPEDERARGLVTASAGNHGQAIALAGAAFSAKALVFVPYDAPEAKKRRIRELGARIDDSAADYDEAERLAVQHAQSSGAVFINAFSDPEVVAGQGTVGLEILADLPAVRTIVSPVGGGGLIAGIGEAVKSRSPSVRVIGAQSVETRVMFESLRTGRVVELPVTPTLADGLAGGIDGASFERVRRVVDGVHLVEEAAIAGAIRSLFEREGVVAEGAAATAVAILDTLRGQIDGPVVVVITGGNIDGNRLARILANT